jgi:hypothetical protein
MSANAAQEKPPLVLICATIVFYTVRLQHARNEAPREAAARTRAIQQFTESLFDGGDKSAGPGSEARIPLWHRN